MRRPLRGVRLFIGVPAPASPAYDAVTRDLLAVAPDARPAGERHLTLRFLGEVPDPDEASRALEAACRGRPALPCVIEGVGTFPGGTFPPDAKARVAWAGVRAPGIGGLADAVVKATAHLGQPPERRGFVAHVTLARLARPTDLRAFVQQHRRTLFATGVLDRVILYSSTPTSEGSHYAPVRTLRLDAQA